MTCIVSPKKSSQTCAIFHDSSVDFTDRRKAPNQAVAGVADPGRENASDPVAGVKYLLRAKGAAVTSSLGQRPRDSCNGKPPALKARFISGAIWVGLTANRCVESRFQRWSTIRSESWGDAPGLDEGAPLALNRYGVSDPGYNKNDGDFKSPLLER